MANFHLQIVLCVVVFTYVNFFDEQVSRKFQHISIQYHVSITISCDFMYVPQMSIIHENASIIIYEQWSLQWQANYFKSFLFRLPLSICIFCKLFFFWEGWQILSVCVCVSDQIGGDHLRILDKWASTTATIQSTNNNHQNSTQTNYNFFPRIIRFSRYFTFTWPRALEIKFVLFHTHTHTRYNTHTHTHAHKHIHQLSCIFHVTYISFNAYLT